MNTLRTAQTISWSQTPALRRTVAVLAGALVVGISAQVAVPVPGSPVPVTMQVPAVLIVGGLLGPRLGAASLVAYLVLGAVGLPVFAPTGVPGLARLFGPTGGYLLAFPVAAAIAGRAAARGSSPTVLLIGLVVATAAIHLGGIAQLAILGGNVSVAVALGSLPFWLGDVLKVTIAGLVVWRFRSTTRALF